MSMSRDYYKLEKEYRQKYGNKTLLFYQCGKFFETYGYKKNGEFTNEYYTEYGRICNFVIKDKQVRTDGYAVYMTGFPTFCLDKYVTKMNNEGFTIVVVVQDEHMPEIRTVNGVYSPGTNIDANTKMSTNYTMCLWMQKRSHVILNKPSELVCGMACIDICTGQCYISQYSKTYMKNPSTYDEIERFYTAYRPNELVIIYEGDGDIDEALQYSQIHCGTIHKILRDDDSGSHYKAVVNCEKQTYLEEVLHQFYTFNEYHTFCSTYRLDEYQLGTQALCFLLNFMYAHNPNLVKRIRPPLLNNSSDRLLLANHSLKQLNIISNYQHTGTLSSVRKFVNKCKTAMGCRRVTNLLNNPTADPSKLRAEYDVVDHIVKDYDRFDPHRKELSKISDFERLYRKIVLERVCPAELVQFYHNLKAINSIYKKLGSDEVNTYINTPNLSKSCSKLMKFLKEKLIFKEAGKETGLVLETNIFNRGVYPELDDAVKDYLCATDQLEAYRHYLEGLLNKFEKKHKSQLVKYHQTEKSGLFLTLTQRRAKILQTKLKGRRPVKLSYVSSYDELTKTLNFSPSHIKYNQQNKSIRLDSDELTNAYVRVAQTKDTMVDKVQSIYKEFIKSILAYSGEIETIVEYVTKLDVLTTKAFLAKTYRYCRPVIVEDADKSFIDAKGMRHILIEHLQQDETYVPNDVILGRDGQDGILLYGTNAVGKSSLIRSIGVCVVLAQSGFFVPCDQFTFKPYKAIFTRILGNDNLFKGQSTFIVEMSELGTILNLTDENSLVLGDELCSGTDTTSAIGIFAAGVVKLHDVFQSSFIFATHFHEVARLEEIQTLSRLSLKHMTVIFDREADCLIYNRKLQDGTGESMYGLEVCKSLHLPQDFLKLAHSIRRKQQPLESTVLDRNVSHYNARKVKGVCELCGEQLGVDIHHLIPQADADRDGFIGHVHKNHRANQANVCKRCHLQETKNNTKRRRTKTTKGMRLLEE